MRMEIIEAKNNKATHQNFTLWSSLILIMQTVELINQQQHHLRQKRIIKKIAHALLGIWSKHVDKF